MHNPETVLEFWFGEDAGQLPDATVAGRQSSLWWGKDSGVDAAMRERFEPLLRAADGGELDGWMQRPEGWLALILVTDQFPRNIHRDTPGMFAFDAIARELCTRGIGAGTDRSLRPIQRVFFYLPLEHSEDRDDQRRCVALMRALAGEVPDHQRGPFDSFVDYAVAHQRIIERFGRFPHRNAILGRDSTPAEQEFLAQPGSSF